MTGCGALRVGGLGRRRIAHCQRHDEVIEGIAMMVRKRRDRWRRRSTYGKATNPIA
jgi:hypothetical protein